MYCSDETGSLVADIGSSVAKFGFGGEDIPRSIFPSMYGTIPSDSQQIYVGSNDLDYKRDKMQISPVFSNGKFMNNEALLKVIDYATTYSLNSKYEEHPFFFIENPFMSKKQREDLLSLFMEQCSFPACYFSKSSSCLAYGMGKSTALTIDMGASETRIIPVFEGYSLKESSTICPMGGDYIDSCLLSYFKTNNITINPSYMVNPKMDRITGEKQYIVEDYPSVHSSFKQYQIMNIIKDIKETYLRVYSKPTPLTSHTISKSYDLPDGKCITLQDESIYIPEVLFRQQDVSEDVREKSLINCIYSSLEKSDCEVRKELANNIIIGGGLSRMTNMIDRINNDVLNRINNTFKLKIYSPEKYHRQYLSWLGGSILCSLGSFQQLWISKEEYKEYGTNILLKRC